jgi:hypothetical protein
VACPHESAHAFAAWFYSANEKNKGGLMMQDELVGMLEIEAYTKISTGTILELKRNYDLPISKGSGGVWRSTRSALDGWLKENGLENGKAFSMQRLQKAKVRRLRQGPGVQVTGDANVLCDRLHISIATFMGFLRTAPGCPILHLEGTNQYTVDLSRFADFVEDLASVPREPGLGECL